MTRNNILLLGACGTLVLAGAVALRFRHSQYEIMVLPNTIDTFKSGLLFANQLKESLARDAWLTTAIVDLDPDSLQPTTFTYAYACKKPRSRIMAMMLDNRTRKAFQILDSTDFPAAPFDVERALFKADLSREPLEIADCLKIAETNGLGEFCRLVPPPARQIEMTFASSETNTTWSLQGDGWDGTGPIADLLIVMDAWSGVVISKTLEKATNRSMP